jgi:hypothetical protein
VRVGQRGIENVTHGASFIFMVEMFHPTSSAGVDLSPYRRHDPIHPSIHPFIHPSIHPSSSIAAFGLLGSVLVDVYGVRKVSMISLSIAVVGRTLIAFGRTRTSLYLSLYLLSPCGDALLSIGLYKVALKKLTTPLTRPLAFALSYSAFNLAGGLADVLIDAFRGGLADASVGTGFSFGLLAGVYTPVRQFIVLTWVVLLLTWVIAYCFLEDLTVIDANNPEDGGIAIRHPDGGGGDDARQESEEIGRLYGGDNENDGDAATPAEPMVRSRLLKRWFPNQYHSLDYFGIDANDPAAIGVATAGAAARRRLPDYKMHKTRYNTRAKEGVGGASSLRSRVTSFFNRVIAILRMRATWRVMVFGFATSTIAMNWTASEMVLPAFLERRFGESTPIYIIQSINLFGCLVLPPLVGAYTSGREDFTVFMPGTFDPEEYLPVTDHLEKKCVLTSPHHPHHAARKDFGSWPSRRSS